jgi:hypothetical protein
VFGGTFKLFNWLENKEQEDKINKISEKELEKIGKQVQTVISYLSDKNLD